MKKKMFYACTLATALTVGSLPTTAYAACPTYSFPGGMAVVAGGCSGQDLQSVLGQLTGSGGCLQGLSIPGLALPGFSQGYPGASGNSGQSCPGGSWNFGQSCPGSSGNSSQSCPGGSGNSGQNYPGGSTGGWGSWNDFFQNGGNGWNDWGDWDDWDDQDDQDDWDDRDNWNGWNDWGDWDDWEDFFPGQGGGSFRPGQGGSGGSSKPDQGGSGGTFKPDQGGSGDSGTVTPDSGGTQDALAAQVIELVNQERQKAGLKALTVNTQAERAAQIRAREIQTSFAHTRPSGSYFNTALTETGVRYQYAGENIAYGQTSAAQVMNGWMNSASHRANILDGRFTSIAVCHTRSSAGVDYWVQLFVQ